MPTSVEIRDFIVEHFSRDELEQFCADYFREVYQDYHGSPVTLRKFAQDLVEYCMRRDYLVNLLAALAQVRPQPYAVTFAPVKVESIPLKPRDPRQVFISHAHEDAEFARRLAVDLQQVGLSVWVAPDSIQPGEMWMTAIDRGLKESGIFVAVLTPRAVVSDWVRDETNVALRFHRVGQMWVLPLMVEPSNVDDLSVWLSMQQYIPFTGSYASGLTQLLKALGVQTQPPSSPGARDETAQPAQQPRTMPPPDRPIQKPEVVISPQVSSVAPLPTPPVSPGLLVIDQPFHLELVRVPAGEFPMGSNRSEDGYARLNELPQHRVYLDEYYIGRYPVTNEQFATFARAVGRWFKFPRGKDRHPVARVSWDEAMEFCWWLSKATGRAYGLPTEAQWEKAARGTDGRVYPWGNDPPDDKRCNFRGNVGNGNTTPVGQYSPQGDSPYGCADMAGNVWEWCADWFDETEYERRVGKEVKNPTGPSKGMDRVVRGGAWYPRRGVARCAYRSGDRPGNRNNNGFRVVVRSAQTSVAEVGVAPQPAKPVQVSTPDAERLGAGVTQQQRTIPPAQEAQPARPTGSRRAPIGLLGAFALLLAFILCMVVSEAMQRSAEVRPTAAAVAATQEAEARATVVVPTPYSGALAPTQVLTLAPGVTMELVLVPAGNFLMGSNPVKDKSADGDEQPRHTVYVSDYYVGKYEVTNAQWDVFAKATGRSFEIPEGRAGHPVVSVSWDDAQAFTEWLSKQSGKSVRLPTEAEWEKACRGPDGRIYPWGDQFDASKLNSAEGGPHTTTPVGTYSPAGDSPYGAADMAGNVWEWSADWYDGNAYTDQANAAPVRDPRGPSSGTFRVVRGGSWSNDQDYARAAYRYRYNPDNRYYHIGFRVVRGSAPVP